MKNRREFLEQMVVGAAGLSFFPFEANSRPNQDVFAYVDGKWLSYSSTVLPLTNTLNSDQRGSLPKICFDFNPEELPFNPKGFILDEGNGLDVYAYNKKDDSLVAQTTTTDAAVDDKGEIITIPGFYDLVILTDLAETPNIIEGPKAGDELYFRIEKEDGPYELDPVNGQAVAQKPGQIVRLDMGVGLYASVGDEIRPQQFSLLPVNPNPFNPITKINYNVGEKSNVSINVYNSLGQEVRTLVDEVKDAGNYEVKFDGSGLSSGMYFFNMRANNFTSTSKGTLLE